jgi:hypothetical protein
LKAQFWRHVSKSLMRFFKSALSTYFKELVVS